jgi:hypothetical protein
MSEDELRKETEDEVEAHRQKVAANEEPDDQRKEDEDEVEAHMRKGAPKKA